MGDPGGDGNWACQCSTLADELADLTFSVPGALGRWLRDQLEAKAWRAAEQKRLSLVDLDKEYRTVLGKLEILDKDRLERTAKLAQIEQERAKDRTALAESDVALGALRKERADILSDQRRWKWVAVIALGVMVGWVLGRVIG